MKHEQSERYSREAYDSALKEEEVASKRVEEEEEEEKRDINKMTIRQFLDETYDASPTEHAHHKAAARVDNLYTDAVLEARQLHAKHKRLLRTAQRTMKELLEFEESELGMRQ